MACTCLPYGPIAMFPGIIALFACILTYSFGFGCNMISISWGTNNVGQPVTTEIGPWTAQLTQVDGGTFDDATNTATIYYSNVCYLYNSFALGPAIRDQFDAKAKTAQAFSMMAIVLAIPLMILALLPCCCAFRGNKMFRFGAFVCVFTMFASFMTLIMKDSSLCQGCSYGWSAWTCIVAGLLWLFTACGLYTIPEEARNPGDVPPGSYPPSSNNTNNNNGEGPAMATTGLAEKEVTRTTQADGTTLVVTKTTTTNPDGSKTVTETTDIEKAES